MLAALLFPAVLTVAMVQQDCPCTADEHCCSSCPPYCNPEKLFCLPKAQPCPMGADAGAAAAISIPSVSYVAGLATSGGAAVCTSDLDCSLNGVCSTSGACVCEAPWDGPQCGLLAFAAASPASGRDLFPADATSFNTWNGPMIGPVAGFFHMYIVLYPVNTTRPLYDPTFLAHGTSPTRLGPWSWRNLTGVNVTLPFGYNPGALVSTDAAVGGKQIYSLWVSGSIWKADAPGGPFTKAGALPDACHVNASPLFHGGAYYCTGSHGGTIMTAPTLQGPWTTYTKGMTGKGEDGFLYIDAKGHWHALFHDGDGSQLTHCNTSKVASHRFSADAGKTWHALVPEVEPYKPVVNWTDGPQAYATMERPHAYFDAATGRMTHIGVAAPLNVGDEGCKNIPNCFPARTQGACACVNCKYRSHTGSLLITLA